MNFQGKKKTVLFLVESTKGTGCAFGLDISLHPRRQNGFI